MASERAGARGGQGGGRKEEGERANISIPDTGMLMLARLPYGRVQAWIPLRLVLHVRRGCHHQAQAHEEPQPGPPEAFEG